MRELIKEHYEQQLIKFEGHTIDCSFRHTTKEISYLQVIRRTPQIFIGADKGIKETMNAEL